MFGTTTLAEVKEKLVDRFGYVPDFSRKGMAAVRRERPKPVHEMNELEKSLLAALDELEREIKKYRKPKKRQPAKRQRQRRKYQ